MTRDREDMISIYEGIAIFFGWFVVLAIAATIANLCGCLQPTPAPPQDAACLRAFRAELLACVNNAKTVEESHACRDEVELRWGYPHD